MDLKKIRLALDAPVEDDVKRQLILEVIAKDEHAIAYVLDALDYERKSRKELTSAMNLELSRAHTLIDDKAMFRHHQKFVNEEIRKFYTKYKEIIGHCFMNMDKPTK